MAIQLLSPDVAAKIAAGEVVERPANVAKELLENSLDAGASEIRVEIREGGQRLLRVTDNGQGMTAEDVSLAFLRHATSKLSAIDDLDRIASFGFRGEALYSIAAVSQVTLATRHRSESFGTQVRVEGGRIGTQQRAGTPVGAIVSVEQLFYNMPARQKFLRKASTEAGKISEIVQRYALAHPDRRFSLVSDGRLLFQSNGSGKLSDVLVKIYGLENTQQMIPVGLQIADLGLRIGREATRHNEHHFSMGELPDEIEFMGTKVVDTQSSISNQQSSIQVRGYTSLPSLTRANRGNIDIFVNRRFVEDRTVVHAVVQAYHTLLPVGRYPLAVIMIEIDPSQVDVNVHPQKTQVRFVDDRAVFSAVQKAVRQAVIARAPAPEIVLPVPGSASFNATLQSSTHASRGWRGQSDNQQERGQQPLDLFVADQPATVAQAATNPMPEAIAPAIAAVNNPQRTTVISTHTTQLPPLRVVGQIGAMYIITEGPEGMYLIDQHAAHERILYEKLMVQRSSGEVARQHLLEPLTLHVGSALAGAVAHHLDQLQQVGFEVEAFGSDTFLVRAVPAVLSGQDPLRNLEEMLGALAERRNVVGEEAEARLVKMICKRASIKAGQLLSDLEMQELVRQLEECQSPRTCPHGRPTMIQLSANELEKAFGRV